MGSHWEALDLPYIAVAMPEELSPSLGGGFIGSSQDCICCWQIPRVTKLVQEGRLHGRCVYTLAVLAPVLSDDGRLNLGFCNIYNRSILVTHSNCRNSPTAEFAVDNFAHSSSSSLLLHPFQPVSLFGSECIKVLQSECSGV